jgi:proline iminopeptidase
MSPDDAAGRHPVTDPHASGLLPVGDGHAIWWESVGDPAGLPAVWLHGGPGSGSSVVTRGLFDPARYRAVLVDQRGCGRSTAPADPRPGLGHLPDLAANTTDHLVADLERVREHLGIDRWVVVGGSWGSTLAFVYAQRHPDRIRALVVAAVTAGDDDEIAWLTRGVGRVFPREWDDFVAVVPDADPTDPCGVPAAYLPLLADPDPAVRDRAALAWCRWEDTHVQLTPGWEPRLQRMPAPQRLHLARMVTHYWSRRCFLRPRQVLDGMPRLAAVPGVLLHGRLDVSGPLLTAWRLHQAWPGSELHVLDDAGHGGASMTRATVAVLDRLAGGG